MPTLDKLREMFSIKSAPTAEPSPEASAAPVAPVTAWLQDGILCWTAKALKAWCSGSKPRFTPYSDGRPIDVEAFITSSTTLRSDDIQIHFGKFSVKTLRNIPKGYLRFLYNELVKPDEENDNPIGLMIRMILQEQPDTIRGKLTAGDVG